MSKVSLGEEHLPLLDRLIEVLETESDPVRQQSAIELLAARHAMSAPHRAFSRTLVEGMHKHIQQLVDQFWGFREK